MIKVAVYAGTRNYYPHMIPAVTSLFENSSVDKVYLLTEDYNDDFPYRFPYNIEAFNVSIQSLFPISGKNYNTKWTYMTLMKVALPLMFPEFDKILYLDVDTIVDKNIDALWDIPLDGYYFGAVRETHKTMGGKPYFNAGVLLINAKELRSSGMCFQLINALNTKEYQFSEQDCINDLCRDKILELPGDYNVTWFNDPPEDKKIIHYAAVDKWDDTELYNKYMDIYEMRMREQKGGM